MIFQHDKNSTKFCQIQRNLMQLCLTEMPYCGEYNYLLSQGSENFSNMKAQHVISCEIRSLTVNIEIANLCNNEGLSMKKWRVSFYRDDVTSRWNFQTNAWIIVTSHMISTNIMLTSTPLGEMWTIFFRTILKCLEYILKEDFTSRTKN